MSVEASPPPIPGLEQRPVPYEALGRPIVGPRALTGDTRRFWQLTYNNALQQWKLRFFGSALGYLWQLVRPLLLFATLYIFFSKVARINDTSLPGEAHDGAQLLSSIVLFTFFSEATTGAVRSVVDNEALVRKIQFPRMVIPLSQVMLSTFNLALNLIVVIIFALAAGATPRWTWLEIFPICAVLIVLSAGVAMLLSALFVYLRDVQPIWEVVSQVIFYASPIIIPIQLVMQHIHGTVFHLYMANPLATLFQQFRHAVITPATPSASSLLGSSVALLVPLGIVAIGFVLGFWVFNRMAPHVAEDV